MLMTRVVCGESGSFWKPSVKPAEAHQSPGHEWYNPKDFPKRERGKNAGRYYESLKPTGTPFYVLAGQSDKQAFIEFVIVMKPCS